MNHFNKHINTWGRGWWTVKYCRIMRFTQTSSVFSSKQGACCYCFSLNTWKTNHTLRWSNFLFAFQINYYLNLRNWSVPSSQVVSALVSAAAMIRRCTDRNVTKCVAVCLTLFAFFSLLFRMEKLMVTKMPLCFYRCWWSIISMSSEKFSQSGLLCQFKQNSI